MQIYINHRIKYIYIKKRIKKTFVCVQNTTGMVSEVLRTNQTVRKHDTLNKHSATQQRVKEDLTTHTIKYIYSIISLVNIRFDTLQIRN